MPPIEPTTEPEPHRMLVEAVEPFRFDTPGSELIDNDGLPSAVADLLPPGWTRHVIPTAELERDLPYPRRSRGVCHVDSAADLVAAVGQRAIGPVALYHQENELTIGAVLNDDHGDTPGHRDYQVTARLRRTPGYQAWLDGQGLHDQVEFAEFIEDHLEDIVAPPAADMLELAQTFHAQTSARFASTHRLQSGRVAFNYDEDQAVSAGATRQIEIPAEFRIAVRPFYGADRVEFVARLRYRVGRGELRLGWQLHRPDEIERVIFAEHVAHAAAALGVTAISGRPA